MSYKENKVTEIVDLLKSHQDSNNLIKYTSIQIDFINNVTQGQFQFDKDGEAILKILIKKI